MSTGTTWELDVIRRANDRIEQCLPHGSWACRWYVEDVGALLTMLKNTTEYGTLVSSETTPAGDN